MSERRAYLTLIALACIAFIISTIGFDTFAKVTVAGDTIDRAFSKHMHYATVVNSLMLFAPFVALTGLAAAFLKARGVRFGLRVFALGVIPLIVLYFIGYTNSEHALLDRKWTAAALSVGLLPFQSIVVLVVVLVGAFLAAQRKGRTSDS